MSKFSPSKANSFSFHSSIPFICSQIGHLPIDGQPLAKCATQSWPFCSKSQGILRGSGCVVLVLERADVAFRRANPILAILKWEIFNNFKIK
jgi:acyl transferase domain-containing protein